MEQQITQISIESLDPHPYNPRGAVEPSTVQDLADSIREKGILEPLLVSPIRANGRNWKIDRYQVIVGHRRLAAAKIAELAQVPCIIRECSEVEQEEIMLVENLQREDLTLLQEARAYQRLIDHGCTQTDIARKIGMGQAVVSQRLQILQLPHPVQLLYKGAEMPVVAAPLLMRIRSRDRQLHVARRVCSRELSIPKLKALVEDIEAVEGRAKREPVKKESKPMEIVYTREDALNDLEYKNGAVLTYHQLRGAFEASCNKCGLRYHPEICAGCPLPQLVDRLINHPDEEIQTL